MIRDPDLAPWPNVSDRRSALDKARRNELLAFAAQQGVREIVDFEAERPGQMGAIIMRRILRERGLVNIRIPDRKLGAPPDAVGPGIVGRPQHHLPAQPPMPQDQGPVVSAEEDALRQFRALATAPAEPAPAPAPRTPKKAKPQPLIDKRGLWRGMKVKDMGINDLRWACKAHGIHLDRRDNKPTLTKKLYEKGLE